MKHPYRIREIAARAGLSEATVDRVLHQRGGVRDSTARQVHQAIADLDRRQPQTGGGAVPIDVVVHAPPRFAVAVEAALAALEPVLVQPRFHRVDDSGDLIPALGRIGRSRSQGLILSAPDTPEVAEQVGRLSQPVVAIGTDLPASKRVAYCGIDNADAGATAAYLVEQWLADRAGDVLLVRGDDHPNAPPPDAPESSGDLHAPGAPSFAGGGDLHAAGTPSGGDSLGGVFVGGGGARVPGDLSGVALVGGGGGSPGADSGSGGGGFCSFSRIDEEREAGFRAEISSRVPHRRLFEIVGGDVHERVRALLAVNPAVRAVYSLSGGGGGGGNAAIIDAFAAQNRKYDVFVAHELDAENAELLRAHKLSAVLHHDLRADLWRAGLTILRALGAIPGTISSRPSPIQVVTPYNIA